MLVLFITNSNQHISMEAEPARPRDGVLAELRLHPLADGRTLHAGESTQGRVLGEASPMQGTAVGHRRTPELCEASGVQSVLVPVELSGSQRAQIQRNRLAAMDRARARLAAHEPASPAPRRTRLNRERETVFDDDSSSARRRGNTLTLSAAR
jgi:hypothetical protein